MERQVPGSGFKVQRLADAEHHTVTKDGPPMTPLPSRGIFHRQPCRLTLTTLISA